MKKQWVFMALALLVAGFANRLHAQDDSMNVMEPVVIRTTTNVNAAVDKAFKQQFKDAKNPEWYRMNKNFLVTFINEDMRNNALFKKNGQLIYQIRFGYEQNLPADIRTKVQQAYADYNITRAVNVRENNRDIWVVNLEGLKKLLIVRVEEGELEEVQSYTKAG